LKKGGYVDGWLKNGRLTGRQVVERWLAGQRGYAGPLHTDGTRIWSYGLLLAIKRPGKEVLVTREGRKKWSRTTSKHLNMVLGESQMSGWTVVDSPKVEDAQ
jgi:hypothetical protein